ncbi:MAG TPA: hypothetical protein VMJ66_14165 [Geobacteraceae bacterium]|nr:hypothetical protein [Geobacteraceae bacterium]
MRTIRICAICGDDNDVNDDNSPPVVCATCGNDLGGDAPPGIDGIPPELPPATGSMEFIAYGVILAAGILALVLFFYIMMYAYSN